jgi:hypothetical protein
MTPEQQKLLQETYEMSKENNKMLHSARRSAMIGGILKMAMYAAFIILPSYFFYTNIVPMLTDMGQKASAAQGKMQNASGQVQNVSNTINQYKDLINGVGQ